MKRDLSNIDDAVGRFKDAGCKARVTTLAYEHVIERHTYRHRILDFIDAVRTSAKPAVLAN